MKKIILIAFLAVTKLAFAQEIEGTWYGNLDINGSKLPLVLHITKTAGVLITTLDSPKQSAKDIPTKTTTFANNELNIDASGIGATYKGTFKNQEITGVFTQGGGSLPLVLTRNAEKEAELKRPQTPKAPFNYNIEDVAFVNQKDGNSLAGTLTTPNNLKTYPVVVLITGSGPENRDSELFGHKPFWVLADDLTKKGIGVLRIDDRGVGQSSKGNETDTSENFAGDISTVVNFLSARGFKNIGLIGHSEGGMIAPMVAVANKKVKFIVSLAGPGIPVDELMVLQTEAACKSMNLPTETTQKEVEKNKAVYGFLKNYKGKTLNKNFNEFIVNLYKKENPEITTQQLTETKKAYAGLDSGWFSYFIKYNPDANWSKLQLPVLALNGTKDIQVVAKENLAGIKKSLEKAKNNKFEVLALDGLNHLFQEAKTGSVQEYGELEQTLSPKVLDKIGAWILGLKL